MNQRRQINILSGKLGMNIFMFSLSLAATGILQQLFNAADIAVVGQFVGKNAMAAVGSNSPIIGLIVNLFVGISLGTNVVIANLTGMKKTESIRNAVDTSLIVALVCGIFATVVGEILTEPILRAVSVPDEIFVMAEEYLRTYLIGLPVILLYNFEAAIFRSQGDSLTPLICLTISGVVNVLLNLFFVLGLHMTANGVALATVISNAISAAVLFIVLTKTDKAIGIKRHKPVFDKAILKKLLVIGLPAGLQSAMFSVSNICIQTAINELGTDIMAASSAAFNIEIVVYYVTNAFAQACTTFTGQNYGAGNIDRCHKVMRVSLLQNMIATLAISASFLLLSAPLISVFNPDPIVLENGDIRLKYILLGEGLNVFIEIFSGAMRGYGRSLVPALVTLFGICGVRIFWVYTVFNSSKTFSTLLSCYPISWAVTALILAVAYLFMRHRISNENAFKQGKI